MSNDNQAEQRQAVPLVFPLWLPQQSRWRRLLKVALGNLMLALRPGLKQKLESGTAPAGLAERLAMAALVDQHQRAGTLESLSHLHRNFWAGEQSTAFYSATESRFEKVFLGKHRAIVDTLVEVAAGGEFHTVCEIGCGSGQVLEFLKDQLPDVKQLIGLDLNGAQMEVNRQRFQHEPRMQFVAGDAAEWIPQHAGPGWIFVIYGGVFEYFTQSQLQVLFGTIASHAPACIALVEPLADDQDLSAAGPSSAYGMELSYSHPYVRLIEDSGMRITWRQDTHFAEHRAVMLVART
ncbi:MAG: class I SAM-dependent methyltransferase [Pseudoxanthomonas sp.]